MRVNGRLVGAVLIPLLLSGACAPSRGENWEDQSTVRQYLLAHEALLAELRDEYLNDREDSVAKARLRASAGVKEAWIVDPAGDRAMSWVYLLIHSEGAIPPNSCSVCIVWVPERDRVVVQRGSEVLRDANGDTRYYWLEDNWWMFVLK